MQLNIYSLKNVKTYESNVGKLWHVGWRVKTRVLVGDFAECILSLFPGGKHRSIRYWIGESSVAALLLPPIQPIQICVYFKEGRKDGCVSKILKRGYAITNPPNTQIPVVNIQIKIIPAILTVAGAIFSCTNYFRVIFTGGVGKNGSTIAVSKTWSILADEDPVELYGW